MHWLLTYLHRAAELLLVLPVVVVIECLSPRGRATWTGRLQASVFWLVYLAAAVTATTLFQTLQDRLGFHALIDLRSSSPAGQVGLALLAPFVADFFYYWFHRAQHAVPVLWRFHAVHHAIRDLSTVNAYHHWTEEFFRTVAITAPLTFIVHLSYPALAFMTVTMLVLGGWLHAATTLNLGFLNRVIADNRIHRVHHSLEPRHFNRNFGSFCTVWDRLFGTLWQPARDEWPAVGLADRPEIVSLVGYVTAQNSPKAIRDICCLAGEVSEP